jgi:hypothetical protein
MPGAALLAVCTPVLLAQEAPRPQFEFASIKLITEPKGLNNTLGPSRLFCGWLRCENV